MRRPTTRRRHVSPGKLARFARAAIYRIEPKPTAKLYAGPFSYRGFHDLWYALIEPIPKTAAGQEIMLHLHSTLREWLDRIEITDEEDVEDERDRIRALKQAAIQAGAVIPFTYSPKLRRKVALDQPPPWTRGPFHRGS